MQDPRAARLAETESALNGPKLALGLLAWYRDVRRPLPWRETRDPYRIWISEVMLQQTRVEAAIPYYERFVERFSTVGELARAPEETVLKYWEGLGYYSRVRNLHAAAREVQERYGGVVPDDYDAFRALPGVGDYTAGAVMSIAYGQAVPAVDGNVLRVFARLCGIAEDILSPSVRKRVAKIVAATVPREAASEFNQAVMELGALVCVPKTPRCGACPVAGHCTARKAGRERELPVRRQKRALRETYLVSALLICKDRLCARRRPARGLLAGLWELPTFEVAARAPEMDEPDRAAEAVLTAGLQMMGVESAGFCCLGRYTHAFSHVRWTIDLFAAHPERMDQAGSVHLLTPEERAKAAFGGVFNRMLADHAGRFASTSISG